MVKRVVVIIQMEYELALNILISSCESAEGRGGDFRVGVDKSHSDRSNDLPRLGTVVWLWLLFHLGVSNTQQQTL